jgi:hypothetical protein
MSNFQPGDTVEGCGFCEATERNGMTAVVKAASIGVYDVQWADGQVWTVCESNVQAVRERESA